MTDVTKMNLTDDLVQSKVRADVGWTDTNLVDWRSTCAETGELHELLKALQFAFKLYERKRSEGRYVMRAHPGHGMRSSESHGMKLMVNMDGLAKPTTLLSNAPLIARRLSEL